MIRLAFVQFVSLCTLASCQSAKDDLVHVGPSAQSEVASEAEGLPDGGSVDARVLEDGAGNAAAPHMDASSSHVDAAALSDGATEAGAAADAGMAGSIECTPPFMGNDQGVGAFCVDQAHDQACPVTRTCLEGLVAQHHWPLAGRYYCTKSCTAHAECGDGARCCRPTLSAERVCLLSACLPTCE
jgi:hypothetical protein